MDFSGFKEDRKVNNSVVKFHQYSRTRILKPTLYQERRTGAVS